MTSRTGPGGPLTPLQPHETALWDAYQAAVKGAISGADSAADKVLTAAFSIATAYGALVGLVAPKDAVNPAIVALPFAFLGAAAISAMWGLTHSLSPATSSATDALLSSVVDVLKVKHRALRIAVVLMTMAIVAAGWVIAHVYAT